MHDIPMPQCSQQLPRLRQNARTHTAELLLSMQPVRDHFENNEEAKALLKTVKSYKATR